MITAFERFMQMSNEDMTSSLRFAQFLEAVTRQVNDSTMLTGTGTPESNITAQPRTLYMDDAGTAGSILYVKKTGSGNTGWTLV